MADRHNTSSRFKSTPCAQQQRPVRCCKEIHKSHLHNYDTVGAAETEGSADTEGCPLGSKDTDGAEDTEGDCDGSTLGTLESVGDVDGEAEGWALGCADGVSLGEELGDELG